MDQCDNERLQAACREVAAILSEPLTEATGVDLWVRMEGVLDACRDLWEEE